MKIFYCIYIALLVSLTCGKLYGQDTLELRDKKAILFIQQLDTIIDNSIQLKKDCLFSDSVVQNTIDTILIELAGFKMAVRRKNNFVLQYDDDFKYYDAQTTLLRTLKNSDSIANIVKDLKEDMLLKTYYPSDTGNVSGPGGVTAEYCMMNLKVRVFSGSSDIPLKGFEVYVKRGIYIPSKDSIRISQLTDNAVMSIAPGRFTVVVYNGALYGKAPVVVTRKPDPEFYCDVKIN
jgi:hypothetical protein